MKASWTGLVRGFAFLLLASSCVRQSADEPARRGDSLAAEGRVREAIIEYRNALRLDPRRADVRQQLAAAYLRVSDPKAALGEVVPAGSARDRALELAATIARNSPVAVRNAKKAMRLGSGTDLASGLEIEDGCWRATAFSGDRAEGVAAFNDKRVPDWPGR